MALHQTYARRKRQRAEAGNAKMFREKPVGKKLLTQLYQTFETIDAQFPYDNKMIDELAVTLREEIGVLSLANQRELSKDFAVWWFNERQPYPTDEEHDMRLSAIELACEIGLEKAAQMDRLASMTYNRSRASPAVHNAVNVINERMLEDGFGFQLNRPGTAGGHLV